jgi:hypothetical protein
LITPLKKQTPDLKVFISTRDSTCDECGEDLGRHAWITLAQDKGALCLACADLDHLVFLPAGDAALTRRARKYSTLNAVVLKWSRARKRYERQGLLVESEALDRAEQEYLADGEVRARRREREAERRAELDRQYVEQFAGRVRELFPGCPAGREVAIAEHACLKSVAGWDAQQRPKVWMRAPSGWLSSPTFGTPRPTTIPCWRAATTAARREPLWRQRLITSWAGGKRNLMVGHRFALVTPITFYPTRV